MPALHPATLDVVPRTGLAPLAVAAVEAYVDVALPGQRRLQAVVEIGAPAGGDVEQSGHLPPPSAHSRAGPGPPASRRRVPYPPRSPGPAASLQTALVPGSAPLLARLRV